MTDFADVHDSLNPELGRTDGEFTLKTRDDNRHAVDALLPLAHRRIELFTRDLDPQLYDRSSVVEAITQFALRHRNCRIRILTHDVEPAVKAGNRLIELCRRLSTYAEIRRTHEDYRERSDTFLLVDDYGLLERKLASRFEGRVSFKQPLEVRRLRSEFDEVWERSSTDPELRRLHL